MALGNNLKKKKLIPDSKIKGIEGKNTSDEDINTKKQLLNREIKKTETQKTKPTTLKGSVKKQVVSLSKSKRRAVYPAETEPFKETNNGLLSNPELPVYIAQELLDRKRALKSRYEKELSSLKKKPIQFVVLTIGSEKYALDIDSVKEVVPIPRLSKTPNTPGHIKGIANIRGNNFVIFDLSAKFDVLGEEKARYLLLLDDDELCSGIPLSVLPSTFRTNGDRLSLSPQLIEDALLDASYIKGLIHDGKDLIYYLDIIELLKNEKAIVVPDELLSEPDDQTKSIDC
ncbi:MAG: chemotaxis protein CheW [Bacteroidota bacterium]